MPGNPVPDTTCPGPTKPWATWRRRKTLLLDDSPQKHGNLLRARYLREQMERRIKPPEAG